VRAAIFFSHLTLVLIWIAWFVLFRGLRRDFLRSRLRRLQFELEDAAAGDPVMLRSAGYIRLAERLERAIMGARHLTLTRLLLCRL
jgi:hypothetical protein